MKKKINKCIGHNKVRIYLGEIQWHKQTQTQQLELQMAS